MTYYNAQGARLLPGHGQEPSRHGDPAGAEAGPGGPVPHLYR